MKHMETNTPPHALMVQAHGHGKNTASRELDNSMQ
jgi:hypothetical protein